MNPPAPNVLDWRTPVGGGLAIVGIGAAVAGAVVSHQADADWQAVLGTAVGDPKTFPAGRTDEVLTAYRNARGKMQLGSVGMLGGAGLTAAGAGLLLWELLGAKAPQQPGSKVACVVSPGALNCSLTFP